MQRKSVSTRFPTSAVASTVFATIPSSGSPQRGWQLLRAVAVVLIGAARVMRSGASVRRKGMGHRGDRKSRYMWTGSRWNTVFSCSGVLPLCGVISGSSHRIHTFLVSFSNLRVALSGGLVCDRILYSAVVEWHLCAG